MKTSKFKIDEGKKFNLKNHDPGFTESLSKNPKTEKALEDNISRLVQLQDILYAHNKYGILIILQAMDAAGKDGIIKHIMRGLNPQGVQVTAFKAPSAEELDHDYLWRSHDNVPERGNIAIFNRSYYEDVIVVKVHNLLSKQNMPRELIKDDVWEKRYRQLRDFEKYMDENGIIVIKFFLNVSKNEQRKRLMERIENEDKNWKFSSADIHERQYWDKYQEAYEEMIQKTSTDHAPWYVIPADNKWFSRLLISEILVETMKKLPLEYPKLSQAGKAALEEGRRILMSEDSKD